MTDKASWAEPLIDDVEAQNNYDISAQRLTGIQALLNIVVGFVCGFFRPWGGWVVFSTLLVAVWNMSTVSCANDPALNPKLKKWAIAAMVCLVVQLSLSIISLFIFPRVLSGDSLSSNLFIFWIIIQSLYIPAGISTIVFIWGRKCGCNV